MNLQRSSYYSNGKNVLRYNIVEARKNSQHLTRFF
jgi:hypothetical protein